MFVYFKEHLPIKGNMRNGGVCSYFKEHLPIKGNMRNGGVCLYFKEHLPIKERKDLELLPETIVAEMKVSRKKLFFVQSYCHDYDQFTDTIEKIYECINKDSLCNHS